VTMPTIKKFASRVTLLLLLVGLATMPPADAYLFDTAIPAAGGCPQITHWNLSLAHPLSRTWSTALPNNPGTILTVAGGGSGSRLDEIEQVITASFGAWLA
jgi:hypothetical protein